MTLIPCVLVYHFLKYVVPCCFLFSRYFSQSEEYWQWFCNVTECYLCVYIYILYSDFFKYVYIHISISIQPISSFSPETTTPGGILQGVPTRPTQPCCCSVSRWFPMEDTKRPVFGAEAERIGTRLDEATDEFLKELHLVTVYGGGCDAWRIPSQLVGNA